VVMASSLQSGWKSMCAWFARMENNTLKEDNRLLLLKGA
jgi:hypothetical protein